MAPGRTKAKSRAGGQACRFRSSLGMALQSKGMTRSSSGTGRKDKVCMTATVGRILKSPVLGGGGGTERLRLGICLWKRALLFWAGDASVRACTRVRGEGSCGVGSLECCVQISVFDARAIDKAWEPPPFFKCFKCFKFMPLCRLQPFCNLGHRRGGCCAATVPFRSAILCFCISFLA